MYYSKGNHEAFARPRKPAGVDEKLAYPGWRRACLFSGGSAFLIRDGQMKGDRITILEASKISGGALDGAGNAETGWLIRGGREMEDHFECLWDLYRSIPSLEIEGASVLDEFFWLNKDDPDTPCSAPRLSKAKRKDRYGLHADGGRRQGDHRAGVGATGAVV